MASNIPPPEADLTWGQQQMLVDAAVRGGRIRGHIDNVMAITLAGLSDGGALTAEGHAAARRLKNRAAPAA
ncbi:hypothetical protein [Streptomyces xiamenensis]|uniref:hypothetical protein n=1 Tax=Streptomyces xiamenensis TaxID=408015 RepID=UPI0035DF522F